MNAIFRILRMAYYFPISADLYRAGKWEVRAPIANGETALVYIIPDGERTLISTLCYGNLFMAYHG